MRGLRVPQRGICYNIAMKRFLTTLLLLAGCTQVETDGPDAQGYKWQKDGPSAPPEFHRGVDVYLNCSMEEHATSCAVQGRGDGKCHVYLPARPESWQEAHELRHCAGWRHPNVLKW